jgi:hypothetical protein
MLVAHSRRLNPDDAQELLSEPDVDSRSDLVLQFLRQCRRRRAAGVTERFPPEFSRN